ncbi:hypothetical protein COS31_02345 [Candidatus Roizmanbacteria bacterium CG02_land_8_20_14_3_00_36_15]|uniref:DUF1648 domain-containing protein n=2 Tax=Candidatus Roizmaniibacteriota TaxID=1752723 RepID=A0A2M8KLQ5_9BACT|nr:MAG: hypothetical protein COS51_03010 [Candidatus Roizmanbacteria bacterium CG03_land_8_20_14_0_80_36_21]PIV37906.1 MAG: hypothetical protein COS31_02345 [Candidatus Roizmanbacteria bacterium CG02_land_8_20_14_3_00_36_15]PIY69876.1 MAG: hypothetical protein COY89_04055 [Candidatus Roizmanbacteria bacterium CG_4_10_14_0_8_um_filter_36_36]PJA53882.1 MAG: hypothetical protein CO166_00100 [Candidatus Roizmanbacteria bacterium CG_4_9_14_3_um_filter_36_11]PJC81714.1 MAG: hypothetical protein CO007
MKKLLISSDLLMLAVFLIRISSLPPQIPLFYSKSWGEDQLVDSWMIFILLIIMNGSIFVNKIVYQKYFGGNHFAKKIIDKLNLFLIISTTLIFLKIIFLVS